MRILQGKRTLIFKEMLASFGHLDKNVVNDVARGFTITGDMPRTGVFEHRTESVAILAQGVDVLRSESFDSRFSFLHFSFCDGFHGCLPEWTPCAERRERAKAILGDGSPGRDFRTSSTPCAERRVSGCGLDNCHQHLHWRLHQRNSKGTSRTRGHEKGHP